MQTVIQSSKVHWSITCFIIALSILFYANHARAENTQSIPLVIPCPQNVGKISDAAITLGVKGKSLIKFNLQEDAGFFKNAKDLITRTMKTNGFKDKPSSAVTQIIISTDRNILPLTEKDQSALNKSHQAYIISVKTGSDPVIYIIGASPLGAFYGAATFVQLIEITSDSAVLKDIYVADYPDIPWRMSADWVLKWDWEVIGYDWGDGLDAFIARCKRKIDLCAEHKVNMIRFIGGRISPGADYTDQRYEMIKKFALELNRYARAKGVALQYSSTSWGVDHYSWGLQYPQPWILNRRTYPDGEIYECLHGTAAGQAVQATYGNCFSNDALIKLIAERQKKLVRELEPGSIYLHNLDIVYYTELVDYWKTRCPQCRAKFPDDEPASPTGMAAAVANLYNTIVAELKSVKNPDSGYDASRDLQIVFASPGYTLYDENDVQWEKEIKYFQQIGRLLKDKKNVHSTFREEFKRYDDKALRMDEMSSALSEVGWPDSEFAFTVLGGGLLLNANMLVSSPVLTAMYRSCGVLYNFNGHVHCEVQALANVNYAWNNDAPGWVDPMSFKGKALMDEAFAYAKSVKHSDYIYGAFLEKACADVYGPKAAHYLAQMLRLERDKGPIWPVLIWQEAKKDKSDYDWKSHVDRNLQAKALVDKAVPLCKSDAKEDLIWLSKGLEAGAKLYNLYDLIYRQKPAKEIIDSNAQQLLAWLDKNFRFQKSDPDGGDIASWKDLVTSAQQAYKN